MGNGVGKAFDVKVVALSGDGAVNAEVLEFGQRPSYRDLVREIEDRFADKYSGFQRRFDMLKVLSESGSWVSMRDTAGLRTGQTVRAMQPGERDEDYELPVKVKARLVFKAFDTRDKGYVDGADVRTALRGAHLRVSMSSLHMWFREADQRSTGRITWQLWSDFAAKYPAIINILHAKLLNVTHHVSFERHLPHYMVSTAATRHRSGQDSIDRVAFNNATHGRLSPTASFADESWSRTSPQRAFTPPFDHGFAVQRRSTADLAFGYPPKPMSPQLSPRSQQQQQQQQHHGGQQSPWYPPAGARGPAIRPSAHRLPLSQTAPPAAGRWRGEPGAPRPPQVSFAAGPATAWHSDDEPPVAHPLLRRSHPPSSPSSMRGTHPQHANYPRFQRLNHFSNPGQVPPGHRAFQNHAQM
eukprot:gene1296-2006_t